MSKDKLKQVKVQKSSRQKAEQQFINFLNKKGLATPKGDLYESYVTTLQRGIEGEYSTQAILKYVFEAYLSRGLDTDIYEYYKEHRKFGVAMTKAKMLHLHGEEKGNEIWNEYLKKQAETNTFEYKNKKYGMTKEEFSNYNASRAVTLENLVKRHGKEEGTAKFNAYCERQAYAGNAKEYFIELYGEEEGMKKYLELNQKKSLSVENFIRKYGEEEGRENYIKWLKGISERSWFNSAIASDFFKNLSRYLSIEVKETFEHADSKNGEYFLFREKNRGSFFYDFTSVEHKIIIEFNGDVWHANPKKFSSDYIIPKSNEPAHERWKRDKEKIELAEQHGFKVIVVWEDDYRNDKEGVVALVANQINQLTESTQKGITLDELFE